jgi:hypothetical protein
MTRKLALVIFVQGLLGITLPLLAAEGARQQVQAAHTERMSFAPGGIIRVNNSYGDLKVEGWDRPEVEITILKSTTDYYEPMRREDAAHRLERINVTTERRSDRELAISTTLPTRGFFLPPLPRTNKAGVTLECLIHAPRDTRLTIHHGVGYVLVSNMAADIEATCGRGDIVLMLRDTGAYTFDARSKFGTVISDFDGTAQLNPYRLGERYSNANSPASRRMYLRMGFGGITIMAVPPEAYVAESAE